MHERLMIRRQRQAAQQHTATFERAPETMTALPGAGQGHAFGAFTLHHAPSGVPQTKLTVNAPGDVYEQEADRIAAQVLRMSDEEVQTSRVAGGIQQMCAECAAQKEEPTSAGAAEEEEELIQAKEEPGAVPEVTPETQAAIDAMRGGGAPLDQETRAFMEPRFGHDFSQVRIHADARAATVARSLDALAFTVGNDIAFALGQYQPGSDEGRALLAHELTHTIQQTGGAARVQRQERATTQTGTAGATTIEDLTDGAISVQGSGALVRINTAMMTIDSGMLRTGGVTQTDTLIANAVIASSYTPGAGNIM
ncbi:DUF4157 domain-containing protein [Roseiflexus castenholzii]|uniref:eCIS core domain-containing protein n=1 Tax=Roseiflexus castenholzii TaxID=120962 RepID=UPI003C7C5F90